MSEAVIGVPAFKARSGREVRSSARGELFFGHLLGYLSPDAVMDAEEFFQARRDEELGRWRCPTEPRFVVYPTSDGGVLVLDEGDGASWFYDRGETFRAGSISRRVALAYFEAHPLVKPWHDAEHGEVWEVTHTGQTDLCRVNGWGRFEQVSGNGALVSMPVTHPSIAAAHRVWPADESVSVAQQVAGGAL